MTDPALHRANATFKSKIYALEQVCNELNDGALGLQFSRAVEILLEAQSHVVVTGVGKSGHIGRKIAATLASTGTPAFFLHPTEASHGDLGMLIPSSVLLALSWSGETVELHDVVARSLEVGLSVIGITSDSNSALARDATVALILPAVAEACPLDVAPTSSTTIQLAIGDALALTCLEQRGFKIEQFRKLHPGGKLGAKLAKVGDVMHAPPNVPLVRQGSTIAEALGEMGRCGFGCVGITDAEGLLVGVITDGDLRRNLSDDLSQALVSKIMSSNPKFIEPTARLEVAQKRMHELGITALFVVSGNVPIGLIHIHDATKMYSSN